EPPVARSTTPMRLATTRAVPARAKKPIRIRATPPTTRRIRSVVPTLSRTVPPPFLPGPGPPPPIYPHGYHPIGRWPRPSRTVPLSVEERPLARRRFPGRVARGEHCGGPGHGPGGEPGETVRPGAGRGPRQLHRGRGRGLWPAGAQWGREDHHPRNPRGPAPARRGAGGGGGPLGGG